VTVRRSVNRLVLGPIVGHATHDTCTIWIQVFDDPARYQLRVTGVGLFPFVSTEAQGVLEFGTAIAVAHDLRPDWRHSYTVLRDGRKVVAARGSFRTMPLPGSSASILFCPISCNRAGELGAWEAFQAFVEDALPHFVLMMGDQVYMDEDEPDVFVEHLDSDPAIRRRALAEKIRLNWSREPIRKVMANVPTYMMWDDHDIRDGWGSSASDSPTLASRFPRGRTIFELCDAWFRDARDVYWHFQACRNPPLDPPFAGPPFVGRQAMPWVFRCGRLLVLMLDSRGERDVFRAEFPVLGSLQWAYIDQVLGALPADVDALVVMTPTPLTSMDPNGASQKLLGGRTDDVVAFRRGDRKNALDPVSTEEKAQLALAFAGSHLSRLSGAPVNLGNFKISNIDEARDQWSNQFCRAEQRLLLDKVAAARLTNRLSGEPRALLFVSGDIHVGAIFDIAMTDPECTITSLTSSGISTVTVPVPVVGVTLDEDFVVSKGIRSTLRDVVTTFNYGIVQVVPTGTGAQIFPALAHEGNAFAVGVDVADLA
jgi:hypothetical protein